MPQLFVSSTFSDMNDERDLIRNKIIPSVNKKVVKKYGLFDAVDLRWGINTTNLNEKDSNKKVVEICLDRIYQCIPFFIVLIGDRYGYSISESEYKKSIDLENYRKQLNPAFEISGKRSITELEIEYGRFLSKYKNGYCFFYVRNIVNKDETPNNFFASSESDKEKIKLLREKAINEYNAKTYNAVFKDGKIVADGLQDLIIEDLLDAIEKELTRNTPTQLFGIHTLEKEAKSCYGREKEISLINNFLKSPSKEKLLVTGPSGVGKSATIARALVDSKDHFDILPFYVKLAQQNNLISYLKEINDCLYPIYANLEPPVATDNGIKKYHILSKDGVYECAEQRYGEADDIHIEIGVFNLLISAISRFSTKETILYLDGIDELDSNQLINSLSFITLLRGEEESEYAYSTDVTDGDFLGNKLKIIISSSNLFNYDKSKLDILNFSLLEIKDIKREDLNPVLNSLFTKSYKKEKPFEQLLTAIVEKCYGKNCLYLNVVMHHLLYLGKDDFAQIASQESNDKEYRNNYLVEKIKDINDDCEKAIAELLIDVCKKSHVPIDIFAMIAICKDGLTKKELYELGVGFNELDYQYVDFILDSFFIVDERFRIKFAHQQIRRAVINNIVNKKHRKAIARFLENNKADHFFSYLENEILLGKSCNKLINELIKENEVISYETLFDVIKNNSLIEKEIVSTSIVEKILQSNHFASENDLLLLLGYKKYQTINVALAYLRLYYIRNEKVRSCINDIVEKTSKSPSRTLSILYCNPIVCFQKIDFSDEFTNSPLIRVMIEIRRLYEKFQNMELGGTKEIYDLADQILKIENVNSRDLMFARQEFNILFYSAINAFERDHNIVSGLQNRLLKEVINSTGNRIIIENYVFILIDINHYLGQLKRFGNDNNFYYFMVYGNAIVKNTTIGYLCDYSKLFAFYRDKIWNPVRFGKNVGDKPFSITKLIDSIEDATIKHYAIINFASYSMKDDEYQKRANILLDNTTPWQKTYYEIKCLMAPYPKYVLENIENRLKQNSPYVPGSDFSIYKEYFNYSRKDKPLEHREHLAFLSILLRLKIRDSRSHDIFANNKELLEIYEGIQIVSKSKSNSLFKIAKQDPFIRLYGLDNYPVSKLVNENPENVNDLARVARVIQYWAEDCEGLEDNKFVYDLYLDAISKYLKCMELNRYEVAYSSYALSCARKAARLLSGISYTERLELFKVSLNLVIEKSPIFDIDLLDEYELTLNDAYLTCQLFNRFLTESILSTNFSFLELVNLSRSVIMSEPNYTLTRIHTNQRDFADSMFAFEFLRILIEASDKSFIREMKSFVRRYSKKTFKPINRELFIEINENNYKQRKLYCDMGIEMMNNVISNADLLKDRSNLLNASISSLVLTYKKQIAKTDRK